MKRWTGSLVLAGLVAVGVADAAAQQLDARGLASGLRQIGFEVDLITDAAPVEGESAITSVDDALSLIGKACECVVNLGVEITAIRFRGLDAWIDLTGPVIGPAVEGLCARFADITARRPRG